MGRVAEYDGHSEAAIYVFFFSVCGIAPPKNFEPRPPLVVSECFLYIVSILFGGTLKSPFCSPSTPPR